MPADHHEHGAAEDDGLAEILDLDAEVLHEYLDELTSWVSSLTEPAPQRIVDLGSGSGTGTVALLEQFPTASVVAVDQSEQMLHRLRDKVAALGSGDRVRTVEADLDAGWPVLGTVDLIWAAASMHHLAEPDRVLSDIATALRPGGLLVVAEMDGFPRFLSGNLAPLESRLYDALAVEHASAVPTIGSDWGASLVSAGFSIAAEWEWVIDLAAPLPAAAARYAVASLRRLRSGLADRLSPDDLAALDGLVDGQLPVEDVGVRTTRPVWVARTAATQSP